MEYKHCRTRMAKAILPGTIMSISGKMGNLIYKTFKKPDGTTETRVYQHPGRRSTPVTDEERKSRALFGQIARIVRLRQQDGDTRPRKVIWAEVKAELTN